MRKSAPKLLALLFRPTFSFVAFCLICIFSQSAKAQTQFYWRSDAGLTGDWNNGQTWWNGAASAAGFGQLNFDNNSYTNMTMNSSISTWRIYFASTATAARTATGTGTVTFYDYGQAAPLIRNDSSATMTLNQNFSVGNKWSSTQSDNRVEIIASAGDLSFGGTWTTANENNVGRELRIDSASGRTVTLSGTVTEANTSNALQLRKVSAGALILSGNNSYTGNTLIEAGRVRISNANALGSTTGSTTVSTGAALELTGTVTFASEGLTLNGDGISTGGSLRNIVNDNTWAGAITNAGNARINSDSGTLTISGNISNNASQTLYVGGAGSVTINGTITGAVTGNTTGALFANSSGSGVVTLGGNNSTTLTGDIVVDSGKLALGASGNVSGAGRIYVGSGATFDISSTTSGATVKILSEQATSDAGSLQLGSKTLTMNGGAANATYFFNFFGISGDTGGFTLNAANSSSTLSIYGSSLYTGTTTVQQGTLATSAAFSSGAYSITGGTFSTSAANLISDTATMTLGGGTLSIGGTEIFGNNGVTLTASTTSTVSVGSGITASVSGALTSSGALTKSGSGQLNLSGNSTGFTGAVTVSAGSLEVQSANALGTTAGGTTVNTGAELRLWNATGFTVGAEGLALNGSGISNAGAMRNVSGANTWQGGIILGGASRINSDAGTLTLTGGITGAGQTLTLGGVGNITISTSGINTSTSGALTVDSTGIVTLNVSGNYTGTTTLSSGTLRLGVADAIGSGGLTLNGGTIASSDNTARTINNALTIGGNTTFGEASTGTGSLTFGGAVGLGASSRTLTVNNTTTTISGVISGNSGAGITKAGTGTLILSGNNSYTGPTQITAGTVTVNSGGTLGTGSDVTLSLNTVLNVNTSISVGMVKETASNNGGTMTIGTGAVLTVNGASKGSSNFQNSISGAGGLTMAGSGDTVLSLYGTQSYTGQTTVSGGQLSTGVALSSTSFSLSGGTLRTTANSVIANSASFAMSGGTLSIGGDEGFADNGLTLSSGSSTISVDSANSLTANGGLSGAGSLTKSGAGVLVLTAAHSTYSGTTTLGAGTLRLGSDTAIGTGGLTINGGTLASSSSTARSIANNITLGANVSLGEATTGTGDLTLSGTVGLGGSSRTLTVDNTTTTISGVISGNSVGITKAGTGTLSLLGDNTFSGNVIISAGTLSITNANSLGKGDFNFGNGTTLTTLLVNSNTTITNTFRVYNAASNAVINVAATTTNTISGKLTQDGNDAKTKFGKDGDGTLILNNSASDFKGQLQLGRGTVILGHNNALGSNTSVNDRGVDLGLNVGDTVTSTDAALLASGGVTVGQSIYVAPNNSSAKRTIGLSGSGTATFNNEIRLDQNTTVTVDAGSATSDTVNIGGAITQNAGTASGIIKQGAGTLALSGANTYSGTTTINAGTLRLARTGGNSVTGSTIAVNNGGTLLLGAANQILDTTGITLAAGGTINTGGNADAVGKLTVTGNSTIQGLTTATGSSAFTFSDVDLGQYTTASGPTLNIVNSSGGFYGVGTVFQFSGVAASSWTGFNTATLNNSTTLNNFEQKIQFGNGNYGALNFGSGVTGTTLTVTAIPDARVYSAAAFLLVLIGVTEYRRRRKAVSSKV